MTSEYTVKLPVFEGPLDLLLHLIKVNEMEISEISLSSITSQYLDYLRLMETLDLEIAGDYLVLAATLIHIKLRSLLPAAEQEEEEEAEQEELDSFMSARALMTRLIEYRRFKEAAQELGMRGHRQAQIFMRDVALPALTDAEADPQRREDLDRLLIAFSRVVRYAQRRDFHQVTEEEYHVEDKIDLVRRRLLLAPRMTLGDLYEECQAKVEMVVTLLALLELCRLKEIRLTQGENYGEVYVAARSGAEASPAADSDEARELERMEADILANRTGLVDDGTGLVDEEEAALDQALTEPPAEPAPQPEPPPSPEPEPAGEEASAPQASATVIDMGVSDEAAGAPHADDEDPEGERP